MAVFRINKTRDYVVMSNHHLRDKNLSLKAKGLLSQILSLPDDWDYSVNGLVAINKENLTAVRSAIKELTEAGYIRVTKLNPDQTESGRFEYIYDVFEVPGIQEQDKQGIENLYVENNKQLNIKERNTDNKDNILSDEFDGIWQMYPRKQGKERARKAYIKARKEGVSKSAIVEGLQKYVAYIRGEGIEERYIKQGGTWFYQQCWQDEYLQSRKPGKLEDRHDYDYNEIERKLFGDE